MLDKYALPYDPRAAAGCSGIRLGTAAVTTQGMAEPEMSAGRGADRHGRCARSAGTAAEVAELVRASRR